jgi:hypothetical protein
VHLLIRAFSVGAKLLLGCAYCLRLLTLQIPHTQENWQIAKQEAPPQLIFFFFFFCDQGKLGGLSSSCLAALKCHGPLWGTNMLSGFASPGVFLPHQHLASLKNLRRLGAPISVQLFIFAIFANVKILFKRWL